MAEHVERPTPADYFVMSEPRALSQVEKRYAAMRLGFAGLEVEYRDAARSGKIEEWAKLAHIWIDLCVKGLPPYEDRHGREDEPLPTSMEKDNG